MIANHSELLLLRANHFSILTLDLSGQPTLIREPSRDDHGLAVLGGHVRFFTLVVEVECYL